MFVDELVKHPLFQFLTGVASIVGLVIAISALLFAWGKYSATADRLREVMERNQSFELRELVKEIVYQELSKKNAQISSPLTAPPELTQPTIKSTAEALHIDQPTANQRFRAGEVINAVGRLSLSADSRLWIVLGDAYGNFYLQNPPVTIEANGTWMARNINLGQGIIELRVVRVTPSGDQYFQQKVLNREWGAFTSLPPGTITVARQSIQVP